MDQDQQPPQGAEGLDEAPTDMAAGSSGDHPTPDPEGHPVPEAQTPAGQAVPYPGGLDRLADRYQLEEPIASGGAAVVWRAFDDVLSRSVAIKLLHPHLAGDPTTVERFRLESINAARLTHTNVVQIYDTGLENDIVYLVMEYVDGPSLRDIIKERGALDPQVVAALGEQVAAALGEAHTQGVVHRDVKPANILLTADGVAKVTDFGIAKALSGNQATLTSPGTVVGTAAYVAPEQLEGTDVDGRADVYALGVVLYECLTGKPAFQGDTPTATAAARLTQDLLPPRQVRADVPRGLDDVITRATRRDPDLRFGDGTAMAMALQPLVRSKPSDVTALLLTDTDGPRRRVEARTVTDSGRLERRVPSRRGENWRRLMAAFVGGLLLAVVGFLATQALRDDEAAPPTTGDGGYAIVDAGDFDPHGGDGEHGDEVERAFDRDIDTGWTTQQYRAPLAALGKPGVGLWFDLGEAVDVRSVALELATAGVSVEVYSREAPPDLSNETEEAWDRVGAKDDLAAEDSVAIESSARRYWLVWITALPPPQDGVHQASVQEIRFLGPGA